MKTYSLETWIKKAQQEEWCARLWQKDPTLWSLDPHTQKQISHRLGWLNSASFLEAHFTKLHDFAASIQSRFNHIAILGMGGSSLGTDVLRQIFPKTPTGIGISVLDSTDADHIRSVQSELDLPKTLFMVCSKSGTTLEVDALRKYFESLCPDKSQFVAITDPGTPLVESMAAKYGYQEPWINPPDIGGRFSVMSFFGMLPAAIAGLPVKDLLQSFQKMQAHCQMEPLAQNPGFELGLFLGFHALQNKNKLTLLTPKSYQSLGIWVEQLIAESTGKHGLGILPVINESAHETVPTPDRCYVIYADGDVSKSLQPALVYPLHQPEDIAGEFLKWKIATAVAGIMLGINPFDEPDVNKSKEYTRRLIQPGATKPYEIFLSEARNLSSPIDDIHEFLQGIKAPEYGCLLAYLPYNDGNISNLQAWCKNLSTIYKVPFVSGFGPRFLHSTGQFHKGGTNQGRFIQITCTNTPLPIDGWDFGFETLKLAQALGDFEAMKSSGRRIINLHLDTAQLPKMS